MSPSFTLPGILERDVDLALVGLVADRPDVRRWFFETVFGEATEGATLSNAGRGIMTSNGESDVVFVFCVGERRLACLVENKISAAFMPRQPERYRERARAMLARGEADRCVTVLFAPALYADNAREDAFDVVVTYEALRNVIAADAMPYIGALLDSAIDRARSGWQLTVNAEVTSFYEGYTHLVRQVAPQLTPPPVRDRPRRTSFIYFKSSAYPKGIRLVHKLDKAAVDVQFMGFGVKPEGAAMLRQLDRPDGAVIVPIGKSLAVRLYVPFVDIERPWDEQVEGISAGLGAATTFHNWLVTQGRSAFVLPA